MTVHNLEKTYRGYISCLNGQNWPALENFVGSNVSYNGQKIGLLAYRAAREKEFQDIPDLFFDIQLLVSDQHRVACRLNFNISPKGEFLGLPVNGKKVSFSENVIYEFVNGRIEHVWSVLDKAAIEAQL